MSSWQTQAKQILKNTAAAALALVAPVIKTIYGIQDNTILFESYNGERVDGSPKSVYDYLVAHYPNKYHIVWAIKPEAPGRSALLGSTTEVCRFKSFKHLMYTCTAPVLVCDTARGGTLSSPKWQTAINTWHGTTYKNLGTAVKGHTTLQNRTYIKRMRQWDYFLSGSKLFTDEVIRKQLGYQGEVLLWGTPRNDSIVNSSQDDCQRCREHMGVDNPNTLLVVYAPTYRPGIQQTPFDVEQVREAFEQRFSQQVVVAIRAHYYAQGLQTDSFNLDLSTYPDAKEVMLAADILISDYSSITWDYSILRRPLFLFMPDLEEYASEWGFVIDPDQWGFPIAKNTEELVSNIKAFDFSAYEKALTFHHDLYGMFEDGHATERVAELIVDVLGIEKGDYSNE